MSGLVSSRSAIRFSKASKKTRIPSRASCAPRHLCRPYSPNETCWFGFRSMSKRTGSANLSETRFVEWERSSSRSPSGICCPPSSTQRFAVRLIFSIGFTQRSVYSLRDSSLMKDVQGIRRILPSTNEGDAGGAIYDIPITILGCFACIRTRSDRSSRGAERRSCIVESSWVRFLSNV